MALHAGRGMRASVDVILHMTEDESLYRDALGSVLGVDGGAVRVSEAKGHYGNRIRVLSARARGAEAARLAKAASEGAGAEAAEAGDCGAGSGIRIRLDKQEFVQGRLAPGGPESVVVRIAAPASWEQGGKAGAAPDA